MPGWDHALWRTLSPLFDQVLDLERGPRVEFVAALRAESPDLAAALEHLLAQHDRVVASGFLESPLDVGHPPASLAGQSIGAYTLDRPLGMGGMGTVWLAHRSDGRFEGTVALKLLDLAVLDRGGQQRFMREGTLLARLSHAHIARLLDAGVTAAGQPYLVLEHVQGTRIDHDARDRRRDVGARIALFLQVADAVGHAHANLVVHRDLKPSNILVDGSGQVKLLDFGIATLVADQSTRDAATLTLTGAGAGAFTPEYAAPEQVQGGNITTATDVYALGVLLYQLLVGVHPTHKPGATHAELLRALTDVEPLRLSDAARLPTDDVARYDERRTSADRLRQICRGDLETILGKALKKAPAERYQSVAAFADDLRRHLANQPVSARPDTAWYRTRKFAARHALEIGAAAAIAAALVAGTGIAVSQARASARERDRALERLRRAEATNDFSSLLLSEATPSGRPLSNAELLARGEAHIDTRFANDPLLRVHMLLLLSERYYENYQFDRWRTTVARAFDDSRALSDTRLRALAACTMALAVAERGDFPRAYALADGALGELAGEADAAAEAARCRLAESVTANMQGDGARAIGAGEASLQLERARRGPPGREIDALSALANAFSAGDRFASADKMYRQLMDAFDAQGRGETRNAAVCLNNWAVMLESAGQYGRAATVASQALALTRRLDTERGASPAELRTVGSILSVVGRHDEALAAVDEAVPKARSAGSPLQLFWALAIAARVHGEAGRLDSSAALLQELDALVTTQPNLPVRERAARERILARDVLLRHQPQDAVTLARRGLARLEEAKRPNRDLLPVILVLASALNANGEFEAARAVAERARAMSLERLRDLEHSHDLGLASLELGIAEEGLQRPETARSFLRAAVDHLKAASGDAAPASLLAASRLARIAQ